MNKLKNNISLQDIYLNQKKIIKTLQYLLDASNLPDKEEYINGRQEMLASRNKMYEEAEKRRLINETK